MITHLFLDFDGVLTDNAVYVNEWGEESVRCSRSDGIGIEKVKSKGIVPVIVSSECNEVVSRRAQKLRIDCIHGVSDKVIAMKQFCDDLSKAAFIGNDVNDYDAMEAVSIPIAVADANPEVKKLAKYVTKARGGHGAVREACGWLMAKLL